MTDHISTCAQLEWRPCTVERAVGEGPRGSHRWSGWPGAWCMDCGTEDKDEVCLGGCECPCHDQFWEEYFKEIGGES